MSEKKSLEEQIGKLTLATGSWVEPMRQWIKQAVSICEIVEDGQPEALKRSFADMDGLNLCLSNKTARLLPRPVAHSPQENIWLALRATKEKAALSRRSSDFVPILVRTRGLEPPRLQ